MIPRDTFAVIGGRGAQKLLAANQQHVKRLGPVPTPFGLSASLYRVRLRESHFLFLPRHGETGREVAAPWVNYRANIYALKEHGASRIMAWSGPAAIDTSITMGQYVLPTDLIDATSGRESSFYKGTGLGLIRQHPIFCLEMQEVAKRAMHLLGLPHHDHATYVCTQGPRLETRSEIRVFRQWKGDLVGRTLAPEVFLARELEMCYLPICCVTDYAEGVHERESRPGEMLESVIGRAEQEAVEESMGRFFDIAASISRAVPDDRRCLCALTMDRHRREKRIDDDWHTWIGKP